MKIIDKLRSRFRKKTDSEKLAILFNNPKRLANVFRNVDTDILMEIADRYGLSEEVKRNLNAAKEN